MTLPIRILHPAPGKAPPAELVPSWPKRKTPPLETQHTCSPRPSVGTLPDSAVSEVLFHILYTPEPAAVSTYTPAQKQTLPLVGIWYVSVLAGVPGVVPI